MSKHRNDRLFEHARAFGLLAAVAGAPTLAATSALQQAAAPSVVQQAQPAFGATAERAEGSVAPRKQEPLGLKPATGLVNKAAPALVPADTAAKGTLASKSNASKSARNLFAIEDRAPITVNGTQTTAGELKRKLQAQIAAKNGPPRTVKAGARALDLAALNVTGPASAKAGFARSKTAHDARIGQDPVLLATRSLTQTHPSAKTSASGLTSDKTGSYRSQKCLDKGPPVITEITGSLRVGGQAEVWGRCLGDRPGRVEVIGQFPGGKLQAVFAAWDSGAVTIAIPGNISGATDHTVAVSVVTAEGRVSPAVQAKFVAARQRVEVPDRLWSPNSGFEMASTVEEINTGTGVSGVSNPARAGKVAKSLRVNPQCALDTMDSTVLLGSVGPIQGWELGPANEAAVSIHWGGTCINTTTTTSYSYVIAFAGDDFAVTSACRVGFQVRAWAYCPVGIAP